MDRASTEIEREVAEIGRVLADTRRMKAQAARAIERSQALLARAELLFDRVAEREARLRAARLPWTSTDGVRRDRAVLGAEGYVGLDERVAEEMERRVREGWGVAGIAYVCGEKGRVRAVLDFTRSTPSGSSA